MQAVTRWGINRGIKGILSVNVNVSLLFYAGGIKIFWPQVNYQPWTIISGKLQERVYLSIVQIIDFFRSLGSVVTWLWTEQAALCFSAEIFTTELKFCFVTRMLQTTQVLVLPFRWEWTTCRYGIFVSLYHACHVSSFFCCCFNISNNNQGFRGAFDRSGSLVLFSYEQLVMRSLAPLSVWQISRMYILFLLSLFFLSGILIMYVGSLCRPLAVKLNTLTRE